jgi:hypothetical protein
LPEGTVVSVDGLQQHISSAVVYYSLKPPKILRPPVEELSVVVEELEVAQWQLIHTSGDTRAW